MSKKIKKDNIELSVRKLVSKMLGGVDPEVINLKSPIRQLGLDSLGMMNMLLQVEKEFGFVIPEQDFVPKNFGTVGGIIDYLKTRF